MKRPFYKSFAANLIYIALVGLGIYWLFFSSLGWITGHGEELKLPDLKGKTLKEVEQLLASGDFDIDVDSTYQLDQPPLSVLDQQPEAGSSVKVGRTIFLIVNKQMPPEIPMPNLVNLSFRSADMLLKSNKLNLGDTTMRPDLAQGAVLEQLVNGQVIDAGTMVAQGSKIDLVIGDGLGNKEINVPDITGLTYAEAVAMLSGSNLQFTAIFDGNVTDSFAAVVYLQQPQPYNEFNEPNKILEGEFVDFRLKEGGFALEE